MSSGGIPLHAAALTPQEFREHQRREKDAMRKSGGGGPYTSLPAGERGAPADAITADAITAVGSQEEEEAADVVAARHAYLRNSRALGIKADSSARAEQASHLQRSAVVDFSKDYLGAVGLQAAIPLLAANAHLRELLVPHNGLDNDVVVFLCRSLKQPRKGDGDGGALSSLALLDISANPGISLAGGLALLSLVQHQSSVLVEVRLEGTQVPAALRAKITKALAAKAELLQRGKSTAAQLRVEAGSACIDHGEGGEEQRTRGENHRRTQWNARESSQLESLRRRLCADDSGGDTNQRRSLPVPRDVLSGWRVIEVPILAPAGLFDTEVAVLVQQVFPKLNAEVRPYKAVFVPLVLDDGGTVAPSGGKDRASGSAGPHPRDMHFTVGCDIVADVQRSRLLTIELVGDRPGSYEQPVAADMVRPSPSTACDEQEGSGGAVVPPGASDASQPQLAPPLHPVMYAAHAAAVASTQWLLLATRVSTRRIAGLPAALAPLLSAEPDVEHPDGHRALVKRVTVTAAAFRDGGGPASVPAAQGARGGGGGGARWPEADRVFLTPEVEREQWERHETFRAEAVASTPVPEFVVCDYPASFAGVDDGGRVRLADMDAFARAVYDRLSTLCAALFHSVPAEDGEMGSDAAMVARERVTANPQRARAQTRVDMETILRAVARSAAERAMVKKTLSNRLSVYVTTPPSRNTLILHCPDRGSLAAALASVAVRLLDVPCTYTVAFHSCHSTLLHCEEPSDLRALMVAVLSQLTSNPAVQEYIRVEVDLARLQRFFASFLAGASRSRDTSAAATTQVYWDEVPAVSATTLAEMEGTLQRTLPTTTAATATAAAQHDMGKGGESPIYVVFLEGIDAVEPPAEPCTALRCAEGTGVDEWAELVNKETQPTVFASRSQPGTRVAAAVVAEFLPRSLARNVRLVATCRTQSEGLLEHLSQRGRDSAEVVGLGTSSANDAEQLLSSTSLATFGVKLSHEDFAAARGKADAQQPEYGHYLVDCLRLHHEEPGYLTQLELLHRLPETTGGMAQLVYDRLTTAFSLPFVRRALGVLRCARWGLPLPILRGLLRQVGPQELRRFLRLLRPALAPSRTAYLGVESGNALEECICLSTPSFRTLLDRMDLATADLNGPREDSRAWHRVLAYHYLDILHRARVTRTAAAAATKPDQGQQEPSPSHAASLPTVPEAEAIAPALLRFAVKELTHHLAEGCLWGQLDSVVLSVAFLEQVYTHGLGYQFLRDLTSAFNTRHELYLLGEDVAGVVAVGDASVASTGGTAGRGLPVALVRHRDYVFFARAHGRKLMQYPELVTQVALERPAAVGGCSVAADAQAHVLKQHVHTGAAGRTFFAVANAGRKAPIHHGAVSAVCAVNNRSGGGTPCFVSAAADRTLCWLNADAGGVVAYHARQPSARIEREITTRTSAYVGVLAEDRTVYICDANSGSIVSRNDGAAFRAPITDFVFSARGRYYFVATADTTVRAMDSEQGFEHFHLTSAQLLSGGPEVERSNGASRAVRVVPHPLDDELFLTIVEGSVRLWVIGGVNNGSAAASASSPARGVRLHSVAAEVAELGRGHTMREAVWLPLRASTGTPVRREELGAEAVSQSSWTDALGAAVADPDMADCLVCPYVFLHVVAAASHGAGETDAGCRDVLVLCDLNAGVVCVRRFALPPAAQQSMTPVCVQRCTVASDGTWLAVALSDGRVCIYSLAGSPCAAAAVVPGVGSASPPLCLLTGFRAPTEDGTATGVPILDVAFHHDGRCDGDESLRGTVPPSVFVVGNEREVRYWGSSLREAVVAAAPLGKASTAAPLQTVECDGCFVLDTKATCFASSRFAPMANRPLAATGGGSSEERKDHLRKAHAPAECIVGDVHGCVVMLSFWQPSAF